MNTERRCKFEHPSGSQCRRYASRGASFCYHHQPQTPPEVLYHETGQHPHPLASLATPEDLFDVIRETLNAARQGRIPPGQAYCVCQLAQLWMQFYKMLRIDHGQQTAVAELFGGPARRDDIPVRPMPLPVKIDEEACTDALPPPRSIEEAQERMREAQAKLPPLHTPEQRAELHRQVAEIEARRHTRSEADQPNARQTGS